MVSKKNTKTVDGSLDNSFLSQKSYNILADFFVLL